MSEYDTTPGYRTIKDWSPEDRPRERLITHGAEVLSDADLIAILIGSGTIGYSAIDIARDIINEAGDISELASWETARLKSKKGIGNARAITLSAAFELAKRIQSNPFKKKLVVNGPENIAKYLIPKLRNLKTEEFRILLLNASNVIFREEIVSRGILNATIIHPREVFRKAIIENAAKVMLVHNHPSGNPEPSTHDLELTTDLVKAGEIINIPVIDHLIIAGENYTSLNSRGYIKKHSKNY